MTQITFEKLLQNRHIRINKLLDKYLSNLSGSDNLCQAMHYSVTNGGKRLRPLLVYIVGQMYGAAPKALDAPACAIEMIHCFSLIHDDLPAMDNDDLRRGKPTCHKAFNEATAILAGDALSVLAFQVINQSRAFTPEQIVSMNQTLALASGAEGIAGGQDLDIGFTGSKTIKITPEKLEAMYQLKTGALLSAAIKLGAIAANVTSVRETKYLEKFAQNIGLAFQIQDDILNIESSCEKLGKNIGTDAKANKITYPALVGIKNAKIKLEDLWHQSGKNLQKLSANTTPLQSLLNKIKNREW